MCLSRILPCTIGPSLSLTTAIVTARPLRGHIAGPWSQLYVSETNAGRYKDPNKVAMNEPVNGRGPNPMIGMIQVIARSIAIVLAIFLIAISIPLFFLPIPLGLPLFLFAMILLAATSRRMHRFITDWLKRHPSVWKRVKPLFDKIKRD